MSLAQRPGQRGPDVPSPSATIPELEGRNPEELSFALSSRRTRLSFQRTRMSADRTLMSIVRTALSLIGFGFTIYQFLRHLPQLAGVSDSVLHADAARNFAVALIIVGVLMLMLGIGAHIQFMLELRHDHTQLVQARMIPHDRFPYSVTLAVAVLLLMIGLLALVSIAVRVGPFH